MLDEVPPAPPCPAAPPLPTEKAKLCDLPTHATSWIKSQSKVEDRRHVVDRIKRLVQYEFPRRYPALLSGVTTNDPFPGWNCKISLFHTYPVVQEGPSCGFASLMVSAQVLAPRSDIGSTLLEQGPHDLIMWAQCQGFTHSGEIFSVENVACTLREHFTCSPEVLPFSETDESMVHRLESGQILLIPYDHGPNHEPVQKKGHNAHWCIVVGFVKLTNEKHELEEVYVLTRHGTSRKIGVWCVSELRASNGNLYQFDPKKFQMGDYWKVANFDDLSGLRGLCVAVQTRSDLEEGSKWTVEGSLDAITASDHQK